MNGRIDHEDTPEGRIAAVAKSLCLQHEKLGRDVDYADFRDILRPFLHRELLLARIDEARISSARVLTERMKELDKLILSLRYPKEFKDYEP